MTTTVRNFPHNQSLNEIYQQSSARFALVGEDSNGYIMISEWLKCRDYFNDVVAYEKGALDEVYIYGFQYPYPDLPELYSGDSQTICIAVKNVSGWDKNGTKGLELIDGLSDISSIWPESGIVDDGTECILLHIDKEVWAQVPQILHTLTFLARLLDIVNDAGSEYNSIQDILEYVSKGDFDPDRGYCQHILDVGGEDFLRTVVKHGNDVFDLEKVDSDSLDTHDVHDGGGIISVAKAIKGKYADWMWAKTQAKEHIPELMKKDKKTSDSAAA